MTPIKEGMAAATRPREGVISEVERLVDEAGVQERADAGLPSSADLDRVAEEAIAGGGPLDEIRPPGQETAAPDSPAKVTTLECGIEMVSSDGDTQTKCTAEAVEVLSVTFFGVPLLQDLHLCLKHFEMVAKGALQIHKRSVSRIVRPGDGLVVPR